MIPPLAKSHERLTMFAIYKLWISLPLIAQRRKHSESHSEEANLTRNAKALQYQERGSYGLNKTRGQRPKAYGGRTRR